MRALLIDAGNTRVTVRRLDGRDRLPRLPGDGEPAVVPLTDLGHRPTPVSDGDLRDLVAWLGGLARADDGAPLVLASVVPRLTDAVREALPAVEVIDHASRLPFVLGVADPAAVGADRLCNVAAAVGAGLDSALVIDAGTATTFDVLLDGVFAGGVIAPGMALAAAALGRQAARLPAEDFAEAPLVAATTTGAAMRAGAWHAGRGGVAAVAGGLRARYGELPVIVTGGLGVHLRDLGFHDPDWTLRGAAWIALRDARAD